MREQPLKIVVDTCVWVDSYCAWHTGSAAARDVLRAAHRGGAQLFYPVHSAKDVLYVLAHEFRRNAAAEGESLDASASSAIGHTALACMRSMGEGATAVGADVSDLWFANKYLKVHGDFEDNLVLAACQRIGADYLVSNDAKLLAHANLAAKTPAQMTALLELE